MRARPDWDRGELEPSQNEIMGWRRTLINLAYRLLGSLSEAEDAVQETYTRWYRMSPEQRNAVDSPGAWLTKVATRICFDQLRSARARRERYVGDWIPEPLPERTEWLSGSSAGLAGDPADWVAFDESINMAFLVVLDSMTPAERVAFILHDVFGYAFAEIADLVGRTPAACRQLASSARHRLRASKPVATPTADRAGIVGEFRRAWVAKDIEALIAILDPDAVAVTDGGGRVRAALRPIHGAEHIARAYAGIVARTPNMTILERTVNGEPGLVVQIDRVNVTVIAVDVTAGRITRIWAIRNPEKLRRWSTA